MKTYCVYCHTTPSNRRYVGISCDPHKRWRHGRGYEKNYLFANAINKYGWDNIKHEILYEGLSLEDAKKMEKTIIKEWNLTDHRYGMNLTAGGDGILSDMSRELMSKGSKGNKRCLGRVLSNETKESIAESLRLYYSNHEASFKGMHHSEETKQKLREMVVSEETKSKMRKNHCNVSGAKNPSARSIEQYTMDGTFVKRYPYAKLAAQENKADLSSLIKVCRGKAKSCGGFVWKYAEIERYEHET